MSITITAYAFARIVNAELKAQGIDKVLPPQMMYTYYKKGFITNQTESGAAEWAYKYITKHFADHLV